MPRIELEPEVFDDFDRVFSHQAKYGIEDTPGRIAEINEAIQLLAHSPLIGREAKGGKRERVIGQESRGYVALYRDVSDVDTVFVLAIRSPGESGCKRSRLGTKHGIGLNARAGPVDGPQSRLPGRQSALLSAAEGPIAACAFCSIERTCV